MVSVIDFFEENSTAYLVMEYLEGETLQQYLNQHGRLTADEAFTMLMPVMKTLEKIHAAGVIHRDISPDNIMHLFSGQLKLMDFGAAREYVEENRSMSVVLKRGYAPMEQYRRNGKQGPWTDVYALCATIYRCITGTTPPNVLDRVIEDTLQKPSQLGAVIDPALENILLYGLAVQQNDRCQSMTELLSLLKQQNSSHADKSVITNDRNNDPDATITADHPPLDPDATVAADAYPYSSSPTALPSAPTAVQKSRKGFWIGVIAAVLVVTIVMVLIVTKPWNSNGTRTAEMPSDPDAVTATEGSDVDALIASIDGLPDMSGFEEERVSSFAMGVKHVSDRVDMSSFSPEYSEQKTKDGTVSFFYYKFNPNDNAAPKYTFSDSVTLENGTKIQLAVTSLQTVLDSGYQTDFDLSRTVDAKHLQNFTIYDENGNKLKLGVYNKSDSPKVITSLPVETVEFYGSGNLYLDGADPIAIDYYGVTKDADFGEFYSIFGTPNDYLTVVTRNIETLYTHISVKYEDPSKNIRLVASFSYDPTEDTSKMIDMTIVSLDR